MTCLHHPLMSTIVIFPHQTPSHTHHALSFLHSTHLFGQFYFLVEVKHDFCVQHNPIFRWGVVDLQTPASHSNYKYWHWSVFGQSWCFLGHNKRKTLANMILNLSNTFGDHVYCLKRLVDIQSRTKIMPQRQWMSYDNCQLGDLM